MKSLHLIITTFAPNVGGLCHLLKINGISNLFTIRKEGFMDFSNPKQFVKLSFVSGMARVLDIGANYDAYNYTAANIGSDWNAIGNDMHKAMEENYEIKRNILCTNKKREK